MRSADKQSSFFYLLLILAALGGVAMAANGCGSPGDPMTEDGTITQPDPIGDNIMHVTVNGSLCGDPRHQYANEPCVSVTICAPGTNNCQTINNILLDTGSYGLRIYRSAITVPLEQVTHEGRDVAECVQFGDNSSEWGPVMTADVKLADEPSVRVPIHVVDAGYSNPPGPCSTAQSRPDVGPSQTGFAGILGVGLFALDCGSTCATEATNGQYWSCLGSSCKPIAAAANLQVQNPVSLLPRDNNGVILRLPDVPADGAAAVEGSLILGIGTQPNNQPSGVRVFAADSHGNFSTRFTPAGADPILSFIDSGSSVLFFPPPSDHSLPDCNTAAGGAHGPGYAGFYCPSSTLTMSAETISATTATTATVPFQVGNAYALLSSNRAETGAVTAGDAGTHSVPTAKMVFPTLADSADIGTSAVFDWGLPFFFGRDVYVGMEATSSPLGEGPYWAY